MQVPCRDLLRYYRAEHDAEAYPCPAGTLGLMPGATSHKSCSPCPAGYICKMTDGEGKYLRSSAEPCPAGHICLRDAVACPARTHLVKQHLLGQFRFASLRLGFVLSGHYGYV